LARNPKRTLAVSALLILILVPVGYGGVRLWAFYQFRAGQIELERYHHQNALTHFQACLKVRPDDGDALLLAARAERRLGDYQEAERFLERYKQNFGADEAFTLEEILMRADRGDVDAVIVYCRARMDRDPATAPLILEAMTHGYVRGFRWTKVDECLRQWLELRPDDTQALLFQALMAAIRDNNQQALDSYRRVIDLDPDRDEARLRLAELLLDLSQPEEALPHLERLYRQQPDNPKIAVPTARAYDQLGRQEEATPILDAVLDRHPNFAPALLHRGMIATQTNDLAAAETWLRQACALEPGDYQAHYQLSQCLEHEGKAAEAKALQPKLKQIDADLQRYHELIGAQIGQAPHDPALLQELGAILLRAGADEEGLRWLNQALKEDPGHVPTHQTLADYFQKTGNTGLAAKHREQAKAGASR
jgi:tetratricopeptide (TPR) repeat protein